MDEYFLHFIWQYQFFSKENLRTETGALLSVFHPGYHNSDQGPDFSEARIGIELMEWYGNVEIHLKSSDWYAHQHQKDKRYDSIILHVVWENDCTIKRGDASEIPVLVLKGRVDSSLLDKYKTFINSGIHLPCSYYIKEMESVQLTAMFDKVLVERLERKGTALKRLTEENKNNWEETFWQIFVTSFGFKINNSPFEELAKAIPYKIIAKHKNSLFQIEALLFGQAGLLESDCTDDYFLKLKEEYLFLDVKYKLSNHKLEDFRWKFMRTRPRNFPTIRIAQLAAVLYHSTSILNSALTNDSFEEIRNWLSKPISPYWQKHYHFGKANKGFSNTTTASLLHSIMINVVVPFQAARFAAGLSEDSLEKPIYLLEKMPMEKNKITAEWIRVGMLIKTAFDSQAGIELYTQYCIKRKCLSCSIGTSIIKSTNGNFTNINTNTDFNCSD